MTDLIHDAVQAGWTIKPTKKGYMLLPPNRTLGPNGRPLCPGVMIHKTSSDWRARQNIASMIKRFSAATV